MRFSYSKKEEQRKRNKFWEFASVAQRLERGSHKA